MHLYEGMQIAYVPRHAQVKGNDGCFQWDSTHPDVEYGFVTSWRGDTVFCRYWRKGQPGVLRTTANSEGTPVDCLVPCTSVHMSYVREALKRIRAEEVADV